MGSVQANSRETEQSLLPGLQDDVTLQQIAPKLSWTILDTLAQVSRGWRRAIRSRKVYDVRVQANCPQTLVPLMHSAPHKLGEWLYSVSLYEPSADRWHLLPRIAGIVTGFPRSCGHVCFNGKLHILGGIKQNNVPSKELYVLDLAAGNMTWKRLADMTYGRSGFLCDVKDGKIYVSGGLAAEEGSSQVEVFDSDQNSWSFVARKAPQDKMGPEEVERCVHTSGSSTDRQTRCHAVEHGPSENHWKNLNNFARGDQTEGLVEVNQKVVKIDLNATYFMNDTSHSWECHQTISWQLPVFQSSVPPEILDVLPAQFLARKSKGVNFLQAVGVVDGEILTLTRVDGFGYPSLFKSRGFGRENQPIVFENISCSRTFIFDQTSFFPIQV